MSGAADQASSWCVLVAAVGAGVGADDRREVLAERLPEPGDDRPVAVAVDPADLRRHFLGFSAAPPVVESAAMKASWGTSTRPTIFIRFLPSFCFSSSLRLRVMSPP